MGIDSHYLIRFTNTVRGRTNSLGTTTTRHMAHTHYHEMRHSRYFIELWNLPRKMALMGLPKARWGPKFTEKFFFKINIEHFYEISLKSVSPFESYNETDRPIMQNLRI